MGVFSTSVVLLSLAVCGTLAGRSLPGGWRSRDVYSDPAYAELAHYAVSSQAGDSEFYDTVLELLEVETQVVAGMNYRLKFSTAETACKVGVDEYSRERCLPKVNLPKATCTAVVYERPWQNHREVTSYECV
ncbi:salivary cystatin-L2-like [Ixodes scapularis]|nr:salivary cystatin-L2-like [Ixodes scapularis]AQN67696.1 cystatin Iscys2 [Ixodes scapularis]